jgi:hypothetical protein
MIWGEFIDTLSIREREFVENVLIAPESNGHIGSNGHSASNGHSETNGSHAHNGSNGSNGTNGKLSQANAWQLRSRVLTKLKKYSSENGSE